MKKFLAFILALACALSLMACGKKNNDDKPDPDPRAGPPAHRHHRRVHPRLCGHGAGPA